MTINMWACSLWKTWEFLFIHCYILFRSFRLQVRIGLDNGLAPNRRQAIILINDHPVHRCIYAKYGDNELIVISYGIKWGCAVRGTAMCVVCGWGRGFAFAGRRDTILLSVIVRTGNNFMVVKVVHSCRIISYNASVTSISVQCRNLMAIQRQ